MQKNAKAPRSPNSPLPFADFWQRARLNLLPVYKNIFLNNALWLVAPKSYTEREVVQKRWQKYHIMNGTLVKISGSVPEPDME